MIDTSLMDLLFKFKFRTVRNKSNIEPKGRCEGYLMSNRWKEGNFILFLIV